MSDLKALKQEILQLTRPYSQEGHAVFRPGADPERRPRQTGSPIPSALRDEEMITVAADLSFIANQR
jgi:hypothetical protein